ncbi:unnamed protein product [Closterium sp. Yama58-4]|nr:unnamed protein product [Closterium sp. Yama58-4]
MAPRNSQGPPAASPHPLIVKFLLAQLTSMCSLLLALVPPSPAASPHASALYIVRLRSAPPVASYRGGIPGFPATAVWDSDPNGNARDATADDPNGSNSPGAASGNDTSDGVGTASGASVTAAAAAAATTSGSGGTSRRLRRRRVNVRAPGVRSFKQLLQRMQQAVLRDSGVDAGKIIYSSTLPSGWSGTCPTTSDFACNNKIIGGGVFHEDVGDVDLTVDWLSPRDSHGHGTWCAGRSFPVRAAAGNSGIEVSGVATISGMAPRARLAIYKVFWHWPREFNYSDTYTTDANVLAAVDQAVADGVDVLTLSMDGNSGNDGKDRTYFDDVPFISALAAGVTVALAVGDGGKPMFHYSLATALPMVPKWSSTGPLAASGCTYCQPWNPRAANTILKPDLIAPGVNILAAAPGASVGETGSFMARKSTAVAAAHVAGVAALIIQQHPDWSPAQIMSAMMTIAGSTDNSNRVIRNVNGKPATPWEMGAGHVFPARAFDPGLTYNVGEQDFRNFLAGLSMSMARTAFGQVQLKPVPPRHLNRPSISLVNIRNKLVARRTVTSVSDSPSTYRVRIKAPKSVRVRVVPSQFTIAPGQRVSFKVKAVVRKKFKRFKYGSLTWVDDKGHSVRSVLVLHCKPTCLISGSMWCA